MKYIVYFEPTDIEFEPESSDLVKEANKYWNINGMDVKILKVLPTDNDGFIIEQPKAHAPV